MSVAEVIAQGRPQPRKALAKRARWWRRVGTKSRGFRYVAADGAPLRDAEALGRIKSLVIPPGWKNVRIAPSPRSRVQAIGIDSLGRVQYRYHPSFRARRETEKYARVLAFAAVLPRFRGVTNADIHRPELDRERVLAVVVRLINELYFRVGNERNVRRHRTYGITTLHRKHLVVCARGRLEFAYVGKHHIRLRRVLVDDELCALVKQIEALGGRRLFCYRAVDGSIRPVTARDVNDYVRNACGDGFTAKDFRTWGGTLLAAIALAEIGPAETVAEAKRNVIRVVKRVAERLGNTPSVCRKGYIHPAVIERYMNGITLRSFRPKAERFIRQRALEYEVEEIALLALLQ